MDFEETFNDMDFIPGIDNLVVAEIEDIERYEAYKASVQIEVLTECIANSPARPYLALIDNLHGEGEVNKLSETQYRILTGAKWLVMKCKLGKKTMIRKVLIGGENSTRGMKDKQEKICWEYALSGKAYDLGYDDADGLRNEIHHVRDMRNQIKELRRSL